MTIVIIYLLLTGLLLLLNAFFVLAEFAAVKARPTQMEALAAKGDLRAKMMQHIQTKLDQYLSVCQVGITLASIGLGFVGEPGFAEIIAYAMSKLGLGDGSTNATVHGLAISVSYILISYLHIVLGEQVPKIFAIRRIEQAALYTALPLQFFHFLFFIPLWALNWSVDVVLSILRVPKGDKHERHSEDEIRIILDNSQSSGMMSFRRLLYIENVLDMGVLTVRNSMRLRERIHLLRTGASQEDNDKIISEFKQSRYPLIGDDPENPIGYIHIKDLFLAMRAGKPATDLKSFARQCLKAKETDHIESLLSEMQRRGNHVALVYNNKGAWTGFVTMEDLLEEVVGAIEEEFPLEVPVYISDTLTVERVLLDVEGDSIISAAGNALKRLAPKELPMPAETIMLSVIEREKLISSYVGRKLAIPHARLKSLARPVVVVARLKEPIPAPAPHPPHETINMLFILLTPADIPRIHQVLLSHIAQMLDSEFLSDRLLNAQTPSELFDAIKTAEQASLA
jgi:CBS domain containing-hemolysin-like protein/mannitol/fructose-specific phosphotransferase system IIA component (Ntr-type)